MFSIRYRKPKQNKYFQSIGMWAVQSSAKKWLVGAVVSKIDCGAPFRRKHQKMLNLFTFGKLPNFDGFFSKQSIKINF